MALVLGCAAKCVSRLLCAVSREDEEQPIKSADGNSRRRFSCLIF